MRQNFMTNIKFTELLENRYA